MLKEQLLKRNRLLSCKVPYSLLLPKGINALDKPQSKSSNSKIHHWTRSYKSAKDFAQCTQTYLQKLGVKTMHFGLLYSSNPINQFYSLFLVENLLDIFIKNQKENRNFQMVPQQMITFQNWFDRMVKIFSCTDHHHIKRKLFLIFDKFLMLNIPSVSEMNSTELAFILWEFLLSNEYCYTRHALDIVRLLINKSVDFIKVSIKSDFVSKLIQLCNFTTSIKIRACILHILAKLVKLTDNKKCLEPIQSWLQKNFEIERQIFMDYNKINSWSFEINNLTHEFLLQYENKCKVWQEFAMYVPAKSLVVLAAMVLHKVDAYSFYLRTKEGTVILPCPRFSRLLGSSSLNSTYLVCAEKLLTATINRSFSIDKGSYVLNIFQALSSGRNRSLYTQILFASSERTQNVFNILYAFKMTAKIYKVKIIAQIYCHMFSFMDSSDLAKFQRARVIGQVVSLPPVANFDIVDCDLVIKIMDFLVALLLLIKNSELHKIVIKFLQTQQFICNIKTFLERGFKESTLEEKKSLSISGTYLFKIVGLLKGEIKEQTLTDFELYFSHMQL